MFKARAVVIAGVVVVPALAVAGLSRYGMSLPLAFSRQAIVSSEVSITTPVAQQVGVQVSRSSATKSDQSVDVVEAARMRDALSRIVEGSGEGVVQDTKPVLSFSEGQEQSVDHLREALGIFLKDDSDLRLTQNVNAAQPAVEPSDDSLRLDDSDQVNAGAFGNGQPLADSLFPSIGVRNLTGQGVQQGAQAPVVQRLASSGAGFSGSDGVGHGRSVPSFLDIEPGDVTAEGDTPAPGAMALGLIGLVAFGRRRS